MSVTLVHLVAFAAVDGEVVWSACDEVKYVSTYEGKTIVVPHINTSLSSKQKTMRHRRSSLDQHTKEHVKQSREDGTE